VDIAGDDANRNLASEPGWLQELLLEMFANAISGSLRLHTYIIA
jgi:hypothetical protein